MHFLPLQSITGGHCHLLASLLLNHIFPAFKIIPVSKLGTATVVVLMSNGVCHKQAQKLVTQSFAFLLKGLGCITLVHAVFLGSGQFGVIHLLKIITNHQGILLTREGLMGFLGQDGQINIIMIEVGSFPLSELPSGRSFFKKGDFFSNFYFLEEGKVDVTISQVTIELSAPIFLGDYEIIADLDHRTSSIKCITRCRVRTLPLDLYPQISLYHYSITAAFSKYGLKSRVLNYWLKKLFVVGQYKRNDEITCDSALGVVLEGQFRLNSHIPIVRMKQPNLQLLRKFEICAIGEQELFVESVVCETQRGIAGVMERRYTSQLSEHFEEFSSILGVASFKRRVHLNMSRDIAINCRKKRSLFQNMVPSTLKASIQEEPTNRSQTTSVNSSKLSKLATSQDVFSVKDNITQFLHQQWRRGLSIKLPKKQRRYLKLQTIRKKRVQDVTNPEMISLSIPREFKEVKFNFKMLLKTKEHVQMRSRRFKTQPAEQNNHKLFFCD